MPEPIPGQGGELSPEKLAELNKGPGGQGDGGQPAGGDGGEGGNGDACDEAALLMLAPQRPLRSSALLAIERYVDRGGGV